MRCAGDQLKIVVIDFVELDVSFPRPRWRTRPTRRAGSTRTRWPIWRNVDLGMDPTIALIIGLGVLAVVIVAIVASSRGGHEAH